MLYNGHTNTSTESQKSHQKVVVNLWFVVTSNLNTVRYCYTVVAERVCGIVFDLLRADVLVEEQAV